MPTPEEMGVVEDAINAANTLTAEPGEDAEAVKQEREQVKWWQNEIAESRDFDKSAYAMMATCRGYAAGLSAHEVSVNIIGSNIDVMKAHLYAKNPDVSVAPARQASLPMLQRPVPPVPPEDPMAKLSMLMQGMGPLSGSPDAQAAALSDPNVQQKLQPAILEYAVQDALYQQQQAQFQQELTKYSLELKARAQARDTRKRFGETLEILVSKAWQLAELKSEARAMVGGALTTAVGWLKATWQEDRGMDPVTIKKIGSLQENIARIDMLRKQAEDKVGGTPELDRLRQQIVEEQTALNAAKEVITARGLVVDYVYSEDITVPRGVTRITKTASMPWLAHRVFMRLDDAKAQFPDVPKECWKKVILYSQRRPTVRFRVDIDGHPSWEQATPEQASQFTQGADGKTTAVVQDAAGEFVCVHEIWDKQAGLIRTIAEGVPRYLRVPHAPEVPTTRFFPFYPVAPVEVDGERYPQSLVQRSYGLQDERNARRSALKQARARSRQGILGNAGMLDKDEAGKITQSVIGEITLVEATDNMPIQNIFMEKPTIRLDPALYEVESIDRDIERIWGIQQAQQGTVRVEQTATESEIQAGAFNAKTSFMREPMEEAFNELAVSTAEMLLQRLTLKDAIEYAGPGAVWPEAASVSDLASLVTVSIKAGSTGKPNLSAERNAWATTMPLMEKLIVTIGQMRGSAPTEVADKLENLADITLKLSGSTINIDEIMPQEAMPPDSMNAMAPPEAGGAPPAAPMPPTDFATGPTGPNNPALLN